MVSLQQGALQIFCGALGTLGFALFFFVRPKHLLLATLGGALSWLIYLLVLHGGGGVFLAALVSSMAVCFWSEALARVRKAPALIFLLPAVFSVAWSYISEARKKKKAAKAVASASSVSTEDVQDD